MVGSGRGSPGAATVASDARSLRTTGVFASPTFHGGNMSERICSVNACGPSKHLRRGFCDKHYQRYLRHGDPLFVGRCPLSSRCLGPGRYLTKWGYVRLRCPGHPAANSRGYAQEHRVVWWNHRGPIPAGWVVHHKNHDRVDNRIENLELLPNGEHTRRHHAERRAARAAAGVLL